LERERDERWEKRGQVGGGAASEDSVEREELTRRGWWLGEEEPRVDAEWGEEAIKEDRGEVER
jgi:hypothetical protein